MTATQNTSALRKAKTEEAFQFHKITLARLSNGQYHFALKCAYNNMTINAPAINAFRSELEKGDLFVEFVYQNFEPKDVARSLFRLSFNEHFDEDFQRTTTKDMYTIPVSNLTKVWSVPDEKSQPQNEPVFNNQEDFVEEFDDAPFSTMTIRDLFCILTRTPRSNKDWLNDEISNLTTKNK